MTGMAKIIQLALDFYRQTGELYKAAFMLSAYGLSSKDWLDFYEEVRRSNTHAKD